jgi:hypothetical protein
MLPSRIRPSRGWALASFSFLILSTRAAQAAPPCPTGASAVYITGSSAVAPFLTVLAHALLGATPAITLVYQKPGSCVGVNAVLNGTAINGQAATYWSSDTDPGTACTIPVADAGSTLVNIGVSDVFAESCLSLPNGLVGVGDFLGPIQTETFIVPKQSTQTSISATAAYFVWGFGYQSGVMPWTNQSLMFRRNVSSGTQVMISAGIGVPVGLWKGLDAGSSSGVLMDVAGVTTQAMAEQTIGIVALTDVSPALLPQITVLAYKHFDQTCAFYPGSTATSVDLRNVRNGHYALWGPMHFLTTIDSNGYPINPNAKSVINYLTGTDPPPGGLDLIQIEALNHVIPSCAMQVQRSSEIGALSSFAPTNSCGCYFEVQATGQTSCQSCAVSTDCPASTPKCSYGYCETQ